MTYKIKPLPFDPKAIKGLSEKILVSHYENNYSGAVKRLNVIGAQLAELDFAKAPVFVINGLKREELIAMNSMILHEVYFGGLGGGGGPSGALATAIAHDFGSVDRWRTEFAAMGGRGWRVWMGDPRLFATGQTAREPMGGRSYDDVGRRTARPRPRHVRTRLSQGLRRQGSPLCRRLHGKLSAGRMRQRSTSATAARRDLGHVRLRGNPKVRFTPADANSAKPGDGRGAPIAAWSPGPGPGRQRSGRRRGGRRIGSRRR